MISISNQRRLASSGIAAVLAALIWMPAYAGMTVQGLKLVPLMYKLCIKGEGKMVSK
jgi:hypothetical protein